MHKIQNFGVVWIKVVSQVNFAREQKKLCKVMVIPVVIGALGMVFKILEQMEGNENQRKNQDQTDCLVGSASSLIYFLLELLFCLSIFC